MAGDEGERLQKVLAHAGVGSRRAVEKLITEGRVMVNGIAAVLGQRVHIDKDKVEVDGSTVPLRLDLVYYLLNKPIGVLSTSKDPQGRPTVLDYAPPETHVWPVGRLDADTEGAILLTNDGEVTLRVTHPRYGVTKTYVARVAGSIGPRTARALARGVELADGRSAPAEVSIMERSAQGSLVEITVTEGRNREVRRMLEAVGHPAAALVRTAIGPLKLGHLAPGSVRRLGRPEIQALYGACGL